MMVMMVRVRLTSSSSQTTRIRCLSSAAATARPSLLSKNDMAVWYETKVVQLV